MNLIAFAASSHTKSINKKLVEYASSLLEKHSVEVLDLNAYELPLYSQDKEALLGHPQLAKDFLAKITESDGIIISFAEHNGAYTTAYKNLFDWCSRINPKVFNNKPMVLFSTSPGARGGANVLETAIKSIPHFGGIVKASLSIPSFYENFDSEKMTVKDKALNSQFKDAINLLCD
jgi:NAD(P)H-dependent FMN reductase